MESNNFYRMKGIDNFEVIKNTNNEYPLSKCKGDFSNKQKSDDTQNSVQDVWHERYC